MILAYKQSDRFPNPVSTFYSEAPKAEPFPVIDVQEGQTVTGVIIRLGPKASQLLIRIIDSTTRRPITDAEVSVNHLGKPFTLLKTGANTLQGDFRYEVLVPAEVPLELRVTAQRYEAWRYQGKLLFTPDSRKELLISLRRRAR